MLLKDKIALVTAGASGMGRAAAEVFAKEGAHVIVVDVNEANAKETVAGIEAAGGSAVAELVDVRDLGALEALATRCSPSTASCTCSTTTSASPAPPGRTSRRRSGTPASRSTPGPASSSAATSPRPSRPAV